ncbi:MAG: hypothetical protein OEZ23_10055 [Gammaproteobacteria bacterium]|nr:hypothetical protein [Gammaproteobacteria bacterium]
MADPYGSKFVRFVNLLASLNGRSVSRRLLIAAIFLLLSGCVTSRIEQARLQPTSLEEDDALVVIGKASYNDRETEKSFTQCMEKALSSGRRSVRTLSEEEFKDKLYPWFEPRNAPGTTKELMALFEQPELRRQLEKTGVKYLAWIDGSTVTTDQNGGMSCALSTFGGGCYGMSSWEEKASYVASIWDLENLQPVGEISADANGTSYLAGLVLPIPVIARPGNEACKALANQLKSFLVGGS